MPRSRTNYLVSGWTLNSKPKRQIIIMLLVNEEKCVGCGICAPFCPVEALHVWGTAEILIEACNECLECIDYCPVDALETAK